MLALSSSVPGLFQLKKGEPVVNLRQLEGLLQGVQLIVQVVGPLLVAVPGPVVLQLLFGTVVAQLHLLVLELLDLQIVAQVVVVQLGDQLALLDLLAQLYIDGLQVAAPALKG